MSKPTASFCYEVITEESATEGDAAERGFYSPGGWEHPDPDPIDLREPGALRTVLESARDLGIYEPSSWPRPRLGDWWSSVDPATDRAYFEHGESRYYSLHVSGVTASTWKRIDRLIRGRS